jgi:hypothetical protein
MTLRPEQEPRLSSIIETAADTALRHGNHALAQRALFEGVKQNYSHSPEDYHHFAIKAVAMPFYDLVAHGSNETRINEAYNVYGWAGNLIDAELSDIHIRRDSRREYGQRVGRISELIIFGLLSREFKDKSSPLILPSTRADDTAPEGEGIDFYLTSLAPHSGHIPLQVKTRIRPHDRKMYEASEIRLLGLSDVDPYYGKPVHPDSLAQRMLRDLNGTATPDDEQVLDTATEKIFLAIAEQAICKSAS